MRSDLSTKRGTDQDTAHYPTGWEAMLRGIEIVKQYKVEPRHVACAQSSFDAASALLPLAHPDKANAFTGLPIFIDNDLPHGKWEVRVGPRPTQKEATNG